MSRDRFSASNLHDPRLVWDPVVHREYSGEDCYFYLIRLRDPSFAVVEEVAKVGPDLDLHSYCIYRVYGDADILIRVWVGIDDRDDLEHKLNQFSDDVRRFDATRVYYDGWTAHPDQIDVRFLDKYEPQIAKVTTAKPRDNVNRAVSDLVKAKLLHKMDPASVVHGGGELVKFYTGLRRIGELHQSELREIEQLRHLLGSVGRVHLLSLYCGHGTEFDYMIKAVVPAANYSLIDEWVGAFLDELARVHLRFRSTTLLVTSAEDPESDAIDPAKTPLSVDDRRIKRALGHDTARRLRRLKDPRKAFVIELYNEHRLTLEDSAFEGTFHDMLRAFIDDNSKLYANSLSWVLHIEGMFANLTKQILSPQMGSGNWFDSIKGFLVASPAPGTRPLNDPADVSLGQWTFALRQLEATKTVDLAGFDDVLGSDWKRRLEDARLYRNDVGHSRFAPKKKGFPWDLALKGAFRTGSLWLDLQKSEEHLAPQRSRPSPQKASSPDKGRPRRKANRNEQPRA